VSAEPVDYRAALEAVERVLNRGGDADDVLRAVLVVLRERGISYAAIRFVEKDRLVDGPSAGRETSAVQQQAVVYQGNRIGRLDLAAEDPGFVERVATLISPYVCSGRDTGGERSPS
jgi:hypothetical protein